MTARSIWRYLRVAFRERVRVPGLGDVPLNVVGLACFGILGFANAGFWFLGIGLELAYLFAMATNARYQRVVDARDRLTLRATDEQARQRLVAQLPRDSRERLDSLSARCTRVAKLREATGEDQPAPTLDALQWLRWSYLKLLVAQHVLGSADASTEEEDIRRRSDQLKQDLGRQDLTPVARDSKQQTILLLEKRVEALRHRTATLEEISSNLDRIDAQVDLAVDKTTVQRDAGAALFEDIAVAGRLLDTDIFGELGEDVAALDEAYTPPVPRSRER